MCHQDVDAGPEVRACQTVVFTVGRDGFIDARSRFAVEPSEPPSAVASNRDAEQEVQLTVTAG